MPKDFTEAPDYEEGEPPRTEKLHELDYMDELAAVWGEDWGAQSEIGTLHKVMVAPPTENESAEEYERDLAYWALHDGRPDLDLMKEQYRELVDILEAEGIDVEYLEVPEYAEGPYTRQRLLWAPASCFVIDGGAILPRYGLASWRKGNEVYMFEKLAELGCPVLHTTHGQGVLELGGNGQWLDPHHLVYGVGASGNEEGIQQVTDLFGRQGVEEIHRAYFTKAIHLDIVFGLADAWLAVVCTDHVDHETMRYLDRKGIDVIDVPAEEALKHSACNIETLEPGKVILPTGCDRTRRELEAEGVDVITWECSEYKKTGGGPHCATSELIRDHGPLLDG